MMIVRVLFVTTALCSACATTGSGWLAEPWDPSRPMPDDDDLTPPPPPRSPRSGPHAFATREIRSSQSASRIDDSPSAMDETQGRPAKGHLPAAVARPSKPIDGQVIGTFRNTYYDFPSESDYTGDLVPLFDSQCKSKQSVPRSFFESLCVQGSGLLKSGNAVSFNRRDCDCAPVCPRTGQKICFDVLDLAKFPWGRGASGQPITPLLTVAVDTSIVPLGTPIYIPEYDGLPRDLDRRGKHDGCFVAQDRGLHVQGQHVDIFTGQAAMTRLWNSLVPSNVGVTVVLHSPRCDRAAQEGK